MMSLMRLKRKEIILTISFFSLQGLIFITHPIPVWSQTTTENGVIQDISLLQLANCSLIERIQPTQATEMNTAVVKAIAKTTYIERQTFLCESQVDQQFLADVSLYAHIIDNLQTQSAVKRSFEVVTCIKDINATILQCQAEEPPTNLLSLELRCSIPRQFRHPILVDTAVYFDNMTNLVKTIEADSKTILCRDANNIQLIKDVSTFTHSYDNLDEMTAKKSVETVICLKTVLNLKVITCNIQKVM